ncbi:MAG TPA: hypothetical protein VFW69_05285, partial [Mycobacterium sp.]|nr:hypothetical protein [Mycobacterium sp.]
PGGVVYFLHEHRGMPIASPAIFEQIGARFRDGMRRFAQANHIPVVRFRRGERKVEVMRSHLDRAAESGRSQVAAIGVAQEFQVVWTSDIHGDLVIMDFGVSGRGRVPLNSDNADCRDLREPRKEHP